MLDVVAAVVVFAVLLAGAVWVAIGNDTMPMPLRVALPLGLALMVLTAPTQQLVFIYVGAPIFLVGGAADILYGRVLAGRPRRGSRDRRDRR